MLFQSHASDIVKNVLCQMVAASHTEFMGASITSDQTHLFAPNFLLGISSQQDYLPLSSAILMFVQGSASPGLDKLSFIFPSPLWLSTARSDVRITPIKLELRMSWNLQRKCRVCQNAFLVMFRARGAGRTRSMARDRWCNVSVR